MGRIAAFGFAGFNDVNTLWTRDSSHVVSYPPVLILVNFNNDYTVTHLNKDIGPVPYAAFILRGLVAENGQV